MIMERIKKWCNWTFILLQIISIIVFLLLANYYYCENKSSIISFYSETNLLNSSWFWSMITAIATAVAAVYAIRAYLQSVQTRQQSSFDAIFSQLLSTLQCLIDNESLRTTTLKTLGQKRVALSEIKKNIIIKPNKNLNVFLNFCNTYKEYNDRNKITNYQQIKMIWETYTKSLCYESNYLNCFKYIYYIIETVHKSPLNEELKKHYVGIIQAQLNHDILFCYLINQIIFNGGQNKDFTKVLKQYDFFGDIYKDNDNYGSIIKSTIPEDITKQYRKKTCCFIT